MPVVTNTVLDSGGQPVGDTLVRIVLGGGLGDGGYVTDSEYLVFGRLETRTQGNGTWQATLLGNALITAPLGSFYQIHEYAYGDRVSNAYYIEVPDIGGPYQALALISGLGLSPNAGGYLGENQILIGPDAP